MLCHCCCGCSPTLKGWTGGYTKRSQANGREYGRFRRPILLKSISHLTRIVCSLQSQAPLNF